MRLPMKILTLGSNTIDTIVFDFDGTLADTLESSLLAVESTLHQFKITLPEPLTKQTWGPLSIESMFHIIGVPDNATQSQMIRCYNQHYREIAPIKARLFPGVVSTLNCLKDCGFGLAIATNELRKNLDMLLAVFGIGHLFQTTCCADEVDQPKPSPDMGREVLRRLDTDAAHSLMLGDSICDIQMAQQNGMASCAVSWGATPFDRLLEASPNLAITDFPQLLDILGVVDTSLRFHSIFFNKPTGITETALAC
jgi:HAD superfamily hydrolase (TIGR01509 family)